MLKRLGFFVAIWVGGCTLATAQVTVTVSAGIDQANLIDSVGVVLPDGNAVRVGYFSSGFDLAANANDLEALRLNWNAFNETEIKTFTIPPPPAPGGISYPGRFGADLGGPSLGFSGKQIYLWVFKTSNHQPPPLSDLSTVLEYGIFTGSTADWKFPEDGFNTLVTSSGVDTYYHANLVGGVPPTSLQLAPVPEPAEFMLAMGLGLGVMAMVGRWRRRA